MTEGIDAVKREGQDNGLNDLSITWQLLFQFFVVCLMVNHQIYYPIHSTYIHLKKKKTKKYIYVYTYIYFFKQN